MVQVDLPLKARVEQSLLRVLMEDHNQVGPIDPFLRVQVEEVCHQMVDRHPHNLKEVYIQFTKQICKLINNSNKLDQNRLRSKASCLQC